MKNFSFVRAFVAAVMLSGMTAGSSTMASPIRQESLENDSQDLVLPLAPSAVEVEVQNEQIQRDRANRSQSTIEAGLSSWIPSNLQTPSRLSNPGAYVGTGIPALDVNLLRPLNSAFNLKLGMGLLMTHRFADLNVLGETQSEEETASIISARLGVEFLIPKISTPVFRPYLTGALLPSMVLTNRTALDQGNNYFGVPVEFGVGSLVALTKTFGLDLGVTETLGSINGSSISGMGVNALVRLPL